MAVLDGRPGGRDPTEACRRIRATRHGADCKLLVLTEGVDLERWTALISAGADDCLVPWAGTPELEWRLAVAEAKAVSHPEAELRRLRDYGPMINDVPFGVFRSSVEGRFLDANPALVRILGYSRPEELFVLDLARDVYRHPEDRKRVIEQSRDYLDGVELAWKRKDGSPITVRLSGRCVLDAHDRPVRFEGIVEDVTAQRAAQLELRASEDRYRLIADNATDMIWTAEIAGIEELIARGPGEDFERLGAELSRRWRFTYVSPSSVRLLGFTPEEVISQGLGAILTEQGMRQSSRVLAQRLLAEASGRGYEQSLSLAEYEHRTKRGEGRWCEVSGTVIRDAERRIIGITGVTRNVHERRMAESALRQSEAALRSLFANMPDFVIVVGLDSTIRFANRGVPGMPAEGLIGKHGFGFLRPEHRARCQAALRRAIEEQRPQGVECVDVFDILWSCRVVPLAEDGTVHSAIVICTDITEQRKAEAVIQREQDLLRRLLELHERDREALAFELHEGLEQQLTAATFNLEAGAQVISASPEQARSQLDVGMNLLRRCIEQSRRLVAGLRPPVLDEFGIVAAVEQLVAARQRPEGPEIRFVSRGRFSRMARPLEDALFRIVQETLGNACRHSRSARIEVELAREDDVILIAVQDWGVGFDLHEVDQRQFGLRGVRERARLLEGEARIESSPGRGTRVEVRLPLIERAGDRLGDEAGPTGTD